MLIRKGRFPCKFAQTGFGRFCAEIMQFFLQELCWKCCQLLDNVEKMANFDGSSAFFEKFSLWRKWNMLIRKGRFPCKFAQTGFVLKSCNFLQELCWKCCELLDSVEKIANLDGSSAFFEWRKVCGLLLVDTCLGPAHWLLNGRWLVCYLVNW